MGTFLEFFAGGGMARAAFGQNWECVWANDLSESKCRVYERNWGAGDLHSGDIADVTAHSIPNADLAWASFPCQDLSLAGDQSGIGCHTSKIKTRSGTFWPFWSLMRKKRPPVIVLENVVGALSSREGEDIKSICSSLAGSQYRFGPLVMDAVHWLPQSRPRLFIVAVRRDMPIPTDILGAGPDPFWHPNSICRAHDMLPSEAGRNWLWWKMPKPNATVPKLEDLISETGDQWVDWDSAKHTSYVLSLMNDRHIEKVRAAQKVGKRRIGTIYRRTREGQQRAEVRFDGIAGCLRTTAGGSSRQTVIEITRQRVRTRLLSPREAARLQGLPDTYWLPDSFNEAYDVAGDGLTVPVVAHLRASILDLVAESTAKLATA